MKVEKGKWPDDSSGSFFLGPPDPSFKGERAFFADSAKEQLRMVPEPLRDCVREVARGIRRVWCWLSPGSQIAPVQSLRWASKGTVRTGMMTTTACAVLGFGAAIASAHEWGAVARPRTPESETCESGQSWPGTDYLVGLFHVIAAANPEAFTGVYAPDNFCLEVEEDDRPYARTRAEALSVRISTGLLRTTRSDADVAAILCHELAHAILQHVEWDFEHPAYRTSQAWRAQLERAEQLRAAIDVDNMAAYYARLDGLTSVIATEARRCDLEKAAALEQEMAIDPAARAQYEALLWETAAAMDTDQAREYLDLKQWEQRQRHLTAEWLAAQAALAEIEDDILGEQHASKNWREEEADEVGWELLVRVGFPASSFVDALVNTSKLSSDELTRCLATIGAARRGEPASPPPRGERSHPHGCWRMFNLAVTEREDHAEPYRRLLPKRDELELQLPYGGLDGLRPWLGDDGED